MRVRFIGTNQVVIRVKNPNSSIGYYRNMFNVRNKIYNVPDYVYLFLRENHSDSFEFIDKFEHESFQEKAIKQTDFQKIKVNKSIKTWPIHWVTWNTRTLNARIREIQSENSDPEVEQILQEALSVSCIHKKRRVLNKLISKGFIQIKDKREVK